MNFSNPSIVETLVWQMKLADYPRGLNRSKINDLMNGVPPYTDTEVAENSIAVNVNFLEGTKLGHDARGQFYNAFQKPGSFFTVTLDSGPHHKRGEWGRIITREINRRMKRSLQYFEVLRSSFANVVLHGIAPSVWDTRQAWCPKAVGVEDVMIPSNTLLTMENLPFFAVYRQYTAYQLWQLTHGPKRDPGWNMEVVEAALKWVDKETQALSGGTWPEVWSPEKMSERIKSDGGLYSSDAVPTVDCWDFYFWADQNKQAGWNRRIILDAWGAPGYGQLATDYANGLSGVAGKKNLLGGRGQFLFNSGSRNYGAKLGQMIHWQFGDLSAVAPFRYHSVRSLGFLNYSVCHLQNRLRCKFNESLFEAMLQYFRVHNQEEVERVLRINLIDKGIIPDDVEFVKAADRWQVNQGLVEAGIAHNREMMGSNAASYVQSYSFGAEEKTKTATQIMAEVNSASALVSSALMQAYAYQVFQYQEICRRFCRKNSTDPDVLKFRVECLKAGVPEAFLNSDRWNVEPERVMGAGNKTLELTVAKELMGARPMYDPEPQQEILRTFTLALTDDPDLTNRLVPEDPVKVTDSVHDAQLAASTLLQGLPLGIKTGMNHIEYVETLLASMSEIIKKIQARGAMATIDELIGLQNMGNHIAAHIEIISQDENEKERAKEFSDELGKAMNMVKGYAQRMEQARRAAAKAGQGGNGGTDPKDAAKVRAMLIQAQAKAANTRESHAQRTAQRQVDFNLEQQRERERHQMEMAERRAKLGADMQEQGLRTGQELEHNRMKMRSMEEE